MSRRLFDHDEVYGQTEFFHYDSATGDFTIETTQDVEPILDENARQRNSGDGFTPSRDMRKIATIPLVVLQLWKEKYGLDWMNRNHAKAIREKLNDADWRYLRTAPGCA